MGGAAADLGVPTSLLVYAAVLAVVVAGLVRHRLGSAPPEPGQSEMSVSTRPWLGAAMTALVLTVALVGTDASITNAAPSWFVVVFWLGGTLLALVGLDLWSMANPFAVVVAAIAPPEPRPYRFGHWPAALLLMGVGWYLLVYPDASEPRWLAAWMVGYVTLAVIAGGVWGWPAVEEGEAFTAWFRSVGRSSPIRSGTGWARLAVGDPALSTAAMGLAALAGVLFDGVSATSFWSDVVGDRTRWEQVPIGTLGFVGSALAVAGTFALLSVETARRLSTSAGRAGGLFAPVLISLAAALVVVHGASLLLYESQTLVALASDPLGRGWDLFGTVTWRTNRSLLTSDQLAGLQVGAATLAHIGAMRRARRCLALDRSADDAAPVGALLPAIAFLALSATSSVALLLA